MYEAQTYEAILSRMLQKALSINGNLDTREGSLVWCGDAPAAVELQNLEKRVFMGRCKVVGVMLNCNTAGLAGCGFRPLSAALKMRYPFPPW